ncbi:MAG: hypothetical protein ABIT37_15065 [Luteolibacter sp.]
MKVFPHWKCFLIVLLLVTCLRAETINWYNTPQKTNLTSTGQNMDGAFQFQLGAFTSGFVPTVGNISQWASHWVSADTASYNPDPSATSFDRNFTVTGNAAPFTVGASAYVWGRRTAVTQDEWILFRKSTWTWPAPNPMDPFGLSWNAAAADQVVLGSINSSGTPFLMKSASIASFSQWVGAELANEPQNAANQDPDHDGVSSLMEFVFGTSPLVPNPATPMPFSLVDVSGQKFLQISIPRRIDHPATLVLEVSGDLNQWNSGPSYTVTVEDSATALIIRDLTPYNPANPKRFVRLKATLP